jgi:gluconokinase
MPNVPGVRSPYVKVGRFYYFGRMLDKIRVHAAGGLPPEYQANLGGRNPNGFDARLCRFLRADYEDLRRRALAGEPDEAILAAVVAASGRSEEECDIWNAYLSKRGWRDERSAALRQLAADSGLADRPIATFFDYFDYDEGRVPPAL